MHAHAQINLCAHSLCQALLWPGKGSISTKMMKGNVWGIKKKEKNLLKEL